MLQPGSETADIARRPALQPRQEFDELFEGPYFGVGPFYEVGVLADEDQDIAGPEKIIKPLGLFARQVEGERDRGTTFPLRAMAGASGVAVNFLLTHVFFSRPDGFIRYQRGADG